MPNIKQSDFNESVLKILIPEEYLKDFDANSVENKPTEWVIELVEKEETVYLHPYWAKTSYWMDIVMR